MTPSCATCQHHQPRTELIPADLGSDALIEVPAGGACTEGPQHMPVPVGHFCTGRWRIAEALIRTVGRLSPQETVRMFAKEPETGVKA